MTGKKHKKASKKRASSGRSFGQTRQHLSPRKIAICLLVAAAISSVATAIVLHFSQPAKVALVDHLSLTCPNESFINTVTQILEQAGYTVDYYPGEEVTVEFYRNLPTHNYDIIVLRVHSLATAIEGEELVEIPVTLFTSEDYSQTRYLKEQLSGQLIIAHYSVSDPRYFGIAPRFITTSMSGEFQDTTVVTMGCAGLNNTTMAEAFVEKGAKVYISWDGGVQARHTDLAVTHLLQHLVTEKQTITQAVENTMKEVGPDPVYHSVLLYYPPESGDYAILDKAGAES